MCDRIGGDEKARVVHAPLLYRSSEDNLEHDTTFLAPHTNNNIIEHPSAQENHLVLLSTAALVCFPDVPYRLTLAGIVCALAVRAFHRAPVISATFLPMLRYSRETCLILAAMVTTGATRIVSVKLYYQFDSYTGSPFILTLLYLLGQSLALVVYYCQNKWITNRDGFEKLPVLPEAPIDGSAEPVKQIEDLGGCTMEMTRSRQPLGQAPADIEYNAALSKKSSSLEDDEDTVSHWTDEADCNNMDLTHLHRREPFEQVSDSTLEDPVESAVSLPHGLPNRRAIRRGSNTGLTAESHVAVSWWVNAIPWYAKPVIPALFNLCNATLRLASLVYMAASIAEVLISGLELVLSVIAARYIRKRTVAANRWTGVWIVTTGLLLVGLADLATASRKDANRNIGNSTTVEHQAAFDAKSDFSTPLNNNLQHVSEAKGQWIGILLIIGQCITSVLQDITEEIFMSENDFPPTLLLGMEGLIGFAIGAVGFLPMSRILGKDNPWELLRHDTTAAAGAFAVYLTLIFTITGIANISTTAATSSMTRNVWKNVRTLLVWAAGLVIHAFTLETTFPVVGEAWSMPSSLMVPVSSVIMCLGIRFYYKDP